MKNINKYLIGIIIGLFLGGIGVYAAGKILASEVSFTSKNSTWSVKNVEDAINDLYTIKSNGYEYLNGYIGVNYLFGTAGGTQTIPTVTENENVSTMKCIGASNAQGTTYIKIDDISKYKSISVIVSGTAKDLIVGLFSELKDRYDYDIKISVRRYTGSIFTIQNELYTIDVSDLSGTYYVGLFNTYTNITVTTIGMLK